MAYLRYCSETVQTGQVTGTISNLPVWMSRTDNRFKDTNHGGYIRPDGFDLNVLDGVPGVGAICPQETELYDGTNGITSKRVQMATCVDGGKLYWAWQNSA